MTSSGGNIRPALEGIAARTEPMREGMAEPIVATMHMPRRPTDAAVLAGALLAILDRLDDLDGGRIGG